MADGDVKFRMIGDTADGELSIKRVTDGLTNMGAAGVKASNGLVGALQRTADQHDGTARRMKKAAGDVAAAWVEATKLPKTFNNQFDEAKIKAMQLEEAINRLLRQHSNWDRLTAQNYLEALEVMKK